MLFFWHWAPHIVLGIIGLCCHLWRVRDNLQARVTTLTRLSPNSHLFQISHWGLGCWVINRGSIPDLIPLSVIETVTGVVTSDTMGTPGDTGASCVTDQHQLMSHSQLLWQCHECHECNVSPRDHVTQPRDTCHNARNQLKSKHVFQSIPWYVIKW